MAGTISSLIIALLLGLLWLMVRWARRQRAQRDSSSTLALCHHLLKPRMPDDCPACRRHRALPHPVPPPSPVVQPWCQLKSRRGAPKRIVTDGFACPNSACT